MGQLECLSRNSIVTLCFTVQNLLIIPIRSAHCPGFSWGNFLSGIWCSIVFWTGDENTVGNILMFLVVVRQSRTLQILMLGGEAASGHSQDSRPQLTKGILHIIRCHAQHIKPVEARGRGGTLGVMAFVFPSNCYA